VSTIPPLFAQFRKKQRSAGVLLTSQSLPIGQIIELLELIWKLTEPKEWENRICFLPTLADFIVA